MPDHRLVVSWCHKRVSRTLGAAQCLSLTDKRSFRTRSAAWVPSQESYPLHDDLISKSKFFCDCFWTIGSSMRCKWIVYVCCAKCELRLKELKSCYIPYNAEEGLAKAGSLKYVHEIVSSNVTFV
jgi:hypothetical protein